jgi:hypothetical protein
MSDNSHETGFGRAGANTGQFAARLGDRAGDEVLVEVDDRGIHITTAAEALKEAQAYFATIKKLGESIVAELIRKRRDEATRE